MKKFTLALATIFALAATHSSIAQAAIKADLAPNIRSASTGLPADIELKSLLISQWYNPFSTIRTGDNYRVGGISGNQAAQVCRSKNGNVGRLNRLINNGSSITCVFQGASALVSKNEICSTIYGGAQYRNGACYRD